MGEREEFYPVTKEMKLIATFAAIAAANWNGQSEESTCGMTLSGASMINSTCTVSGSSIKAMYAGNGAFITGANTMTGFDDISGDASVVVFFNQDCSSGECDNSTCWDATMDCVDNGAASSGNLNLQIAGVSMGDSVQISLVDDNGNGVSLKNITSPSGDVSADESDNGSFSVTAGENFGDLFQVSVNAGGVVNLWLSTVA